MGWDGMAGTEVGVGGELKVGAKGTLGWVGLLID